MRRRASLRRLSAAALITAVLAGCGQNGAPGEEADAPLGKHTPRLLPAAGVLAGANLPTLDPHTMSDAEIEEVIGAPPHCTFRYTSAGKPVIAVITEDTAEATGAAGVLKLDGDLVALQAVPAESGMRLVADPIGLSLTAGQEAALVAPGQRDATLIFEIGDEMQVGYRGYFACGE